MNDLRDEIRNDRRADLARREAFEDMVVKKLAKIEDLVGTINMRLAAGPWRPLLEKDP